VTDDATLSDFDTAADEESADDSRSNPNRSTTAEPRAGEIAQSTYAWGEYTCEQCTGTTDRVWRVDGDLVCPDCKTW